MIRKKITNFDVIRHSMDWKLGMQENDPRKILESKWAAEFFSELRSRYDHELMGVFFEGMKVRLIFGDFRYGRDCPFLLAGFYRNYQQAADNRIRLYLEDNNLENLIDAANCFYIHWVATGDRDMMGCILATFNLFVEGVDKGHKTTTVHDRKEKDRIHKTC